jgi:hypothetical protein
MRILVAIAIAFATVFAIGIVFRTDIFDWASPAFEPLFRPLDSGPAPEAGVCSWAVNAVILSVPIYFVLARVSQHRKD